MLHIFNTYCAIYRAYNMRIYYYICIRTVHQWPRLVHLSGLVHLCFSCQPLPLGVVSPATVNQHGSASRRSSIASPNDHLCCHVDIRHILTILWRCIGTYVSTHAHILYNMYSICRLHMYCLYIVIYCQYITLNNLDTYPREHLAGNPSHSCLCF